jgi:hypothetical protein
MKPLPFRASCAALLALALGLSATLLAPAAQAQIVDATDRGWHTQSGIHVASNLNYLVGFSRGLGEVHRNWYVFDIPTLATGETFATATLRVFNPTVDAGGFDGYQSPNPTEEYTLYDYTGAITTLRANRAGGGLTGQSIFSDLGTGQTYGSRTFSNSDNGTFSLISLNAAALTAINASAGTFFALGGAVTTLSGQTAAEEAIFESTFAPDVPLSSTQLILTRQQASVAPEPSALALLAPVLPLAGVVIRKRRKA